MGRRQLLFGVVIALLIAGSLYSASAFGLMGIENEKHAIQINDLGCELTDFEIHVDLWHASIVGSHIVTLNNSGDTVVTIRWNEEGAQNEMILPAKTERRYSVNYRFQLVTMDFTYEYNAIRK
uniref:Uncharacterized protein n=1 Tax=Candidatus Methanophaga sp. ANME-1 ERB7 TaxID=2759913 RepID=A0A7G9ZCE5_9EURY|nr:hypothetical protein GHLLLOKB_00017 [Methanosarcinales archaeon ANME-1 ERB7]